MEAIPAGTKGIVCDLDGTLAQSKAPIDAEMASLIAKLLAKRRFAVLGGGNAPLFFAQVVVPLEAAGARARFRRLGLFPTSGARGFRHRDGTWEEFYAEKFAPHEVERIRYAFAYAFIKTRYHHPPKTYGELIEDRETAVVFSAVGQQAPLAAKEAWRRAHDRRTELKRALSRLLPEYEVKVGGLTSIDVTKKGVDKAFGMRRIAELFALPIDDLVFIGDALFPGGNDEPVKKTGVATIAVAAPEDTKRLFRQLLALQPRPALLQC